MECCSFKPFFPHIGCIKTDLFPILSLSDTEQHICLSNIGLIKGNLTENFSLCSAHKNQIDSDHRLKIKSTLCVVPYHLSTHKRNNVHGERKITIDMMKKVNANTGIVLPVGTAICTNCRKNLLLSTKQSNPNTDQDTCSLENCQMEFAVDPLCTTRDDMPSDEAENLLFHTDTNVTCGKQTRKRKFDFMACSTNEQDNDSQSTVIMSSQTTDASVMEIEKLEKLNDFLLVTSSSPVKNFQVPFSNCSERSKQRYLQKARQCIDTVLETICPGEGDILAGALFPPVSETKMPDPLQFALTESYNKAETWALKKQLLSIISKDKSFDEVSAMIPGITRYRYYMSKQHERDEGCGMPLVISDTKRKKIDEGTLESFIDFITSSHIIKDLPFGEKTLKLSSGEVIKTLNVIRSMAPSSIIRQYKQYCQEENIETLGTSTMYKILDECAASVRKSVEGVDYFIAEGGRAFGDLEAITNKLEITNEKSKEIKTNLQEAKRYLKTDFKVHLTEENSIPDHCLGFALSDNDSCYKKSCFTHLHTEQCNSCSNLDLTLKEIQDLAEEACFDNREAVLFQVEKAASDILEWKRHLLRARNQNRAKTSLLSNMEEDECLVIADWAMKFLPRRYREGQTDWFGKRGLNWHISVVYTKEGEELKSSTYVHIFDGPASQDSSTTSAVLVDVASDILANYQPNKFHFWSDNAGCYKSTNTLIVLHQHLDEKLGTYDFCEPQDGKGPCDRKSSHMKAIIKRFINEGNDVLNAKQMKQAIDYRQVGETRYKVKVVDAVIDLEKGDAGLRAIPSISSLHNFQFSNEGITVWKAFGIGKGKLVSWKKIRQGDIQIPELKTIIDWKNYPNVIPPTNVAQKTAKELFCCPNEGCVRTFGTNSALDQHIMLGLCDFRKEKQNLIDRAKSIYAEKLIENNGNPLPVTLQSRDSSSEVSLLKQGWALKVRKGQTQFNTKQKEYLIQKFDKGNRTGKKEDPFMVADEMRTEKSVTGEYLFRRDEYLTAQQIASFFSREVQKRKKIDNDDLRAAVEEEDKSNLKNIILQTLS